MSEAHLESRLKVVPALLESARLAARHWLLGLVAAAILSGMLLLLLDLAAWCFAPGRDACVGRAYFNLPMGQQRSLINDAAILFPLAAAFVVSVVMLRLFYLSEGTFKEVASRPQKLRLARFLGRCAVTWGPRSDATCHTRHGIHACKLVLVSKTPAWRGCNSFQLCGYQSGWPPLRILSTCEIDPVCPRRHFSEATGDL